VRPRWKCRVEYLAVGARAEEGGANRHGVPLRSVIAVYCWTVILIGLSLWI
jgi:hypothetical protein